MIPEFQKIAVKPTRKTEFRENRKTAKKKKYYTHAGEKRHALVDYYWYFL